MQTNQVVMVVVAVLSGSIGGAAVSTWLSRPQQPAVERSQHQVKLAPVETPQPLAPLFHALNDQHVNERLERIAARVGQLEHEEESSASAAAAQEPPPAEFYHRMHAETIREHQAEAVDPSFGPATMPIVRKDFERVEALGGFQTGAVDCRTTSCSVALKWPSLHEAKSHYIHAIGASLRIGCSKTIVIPEQANADGSVEATLMLDCTEWRASGAEPLAEAELPPPPVATKSD